MILSTQGTLRNGQHPNSLQQRGRVGVHQVFNEYIFLYYIISSQFLTGNQLNLILSTKQIVVDVCEGVQHVSEVLKIILRRLAIKNYLMDST